MLTYDDDDDEMSAASFSFMDNLKVRVPCSWIVFYKKTY